MSEKEYERRAEKIKIINLLLDDCERYLNRSEDLDRRKRSLSAIHTNEIETLNNEISKCVGIGNYCFFLAQKLNRELDEDDE